MNHLFIIFSENGRLTSYCSELLEHTHQDLLRDIHVVFLNGEPLLIPIHDDTISIRENGVLLVYDANEKVAYDKQPTLAILKKISGEYKHLYVCYHEASADGWQEALNGLELTFEKVPMKRSHPEEPYRLLHRLYKGEITIQNLIEFWHKEEINHLNDNRTGLKLSLHTAFRKKNKAHLENKTNKALIAACRFNSEELRVLDKLIAQISGDPDQLTWDQMVEDFIRKIQLT